MEPMITTVPYTTTVVTESSGGNPWISLFIYIIVSAAYWKVFEKAGHRGWKALVPVYNMYIILQMVNKPWWYLLLFLIPIVNVVVYIVVMLQLGRAFGKNGWWSFFLLVLLPIVGPILLGFGDATYKAPKAK